MSAGGSTAHRCFEAAKPKQALSGVCGFATQLCFPPTPAEAFNDRPEPGTVCCHLCSCPLAFPLNLTHSCYFSSWCIY